MFQETLQFIGRILTMSEHIPKWLFLGNMSVACASGFVMNIILLYLIQKRTPREMVSYSRIMRVHAASDMFYDLIQAVAGVQAAPINGKIYSVLHGFEWQKPPQMALTTICFYYWSLLFSMALLPIDFIYRYRSVVKNKDLSNKYLFLMVFLAYFITWFQAFINTPMFLLIGHLPETKEYTQELEMFWSEKPVPPFSITPLASYKTAINFGLLSLLNVSVYGTIFYTYSKIRIALRRNANNINNQRSISIHKQVSRLLALQAILPILVGCIPIMLIVAFTFMKLNLPHSGAYFSFVYVWLGTLKPVLTIVIVPRYRKHLKTMFCCGVTKIDQRSTGPTFSPSTNPNQTTQQQLSAMDNSSNNIQTSVNDYGNNIDGNNNIDVNGRQNQYLVE